MDWLVKDLLPKQSKVMDMVIEGGGKTRNSCALCVHIATGRPYLGREVSQGDVFIIDSETPKRSLDTWLNRFAIRLGFEDYHSLPNKIRIVKGFKFGRANQGIMNAIRTIKPVFIRMESVVAMLPTGRQGLVETDATLGATIRDNLNDILELAPDATIMLSAHNKMATKDFTLQQVKEAEMTSLVRGHGSIVGQGCDTGLSIFKVSNRKPEDDSTRTIFVLLPKPRRFPIPVSEIWVELKEEAYGKGKAWLEVTEPITPPPTKLELTLYRHLLHNPYSPQFKLRSAFSLIPGKTVYDALLSDIDRGLVIETDDMTYYATVTQDIPKEFAEAINPFKNSAIPL